MNIENDTLPPAAEPAPLPLPLPRVTQPPRTKNQIRATALADGLAVKAKWKTLIAEARTIWDKVPPEDLAKVDGNFHRLAGLVQLRYQLSREESDRQVKEFFGRHYPAA